MTGTGWNCCLRAGLVGLPAVLCGCFTPGYYVDYPEGRATLHEVPAPNTDVVVAQEPIVPALPSGTDPGSSAQASCRWNDHILAENFWRDANRAAADGTEFPEPPQPSCPDVDIIIEAALEASDQAHERQALEIVREHVEEDEQRTHEFAVALAENLPDGGSAQATATGTGIGEGTVATDSESSGRHRASSPSTTARPVPDDARQPRICPDAPDQPSPAAIPGGP